jgi:hypothetical protein
MLCGAQQHKMYILTPCNTSCLGIGFDLMDEADAATFQEIATYVDRLGGRSKNIPRPFAYQLEGVRKLVHGLTMNQGMVLGDVMGLGKTLQGLLVALFVVAQTCPGMGTGFGVSGASGDSVTRNARASRIDVFVRDESRRKKSVGHASSNSSESLTSLSSSSSDEDFGTVRKRMRTVTLGPQKVARVVPALFIVPRSAMAAWQRQADAIFPGCFEDGRAYALKNQAPGSVIPQDVLFAFATPGKVKSKAQRHKFMRPWSIVVVDEAHDILHMTTKAYLAVHDIVHAVAPVVDKRGRSSVPPKVLLLTGTPVSDSQPARSLAAIFKLLNSADPKEHTTVYWQDLLGVGGAGAGGSSSTNTGAGAGAGSSTNTGAGTGEGVGDEDVLDGLGIRAVQLSSGAATVKRALDRVMVRRTHATATGGFEHASSEVVYVDVHASPAECEAYYCVGDKLLRLLPPLLQMLHRARLSPEEERQRSQMLKSSFELLRRSQAVFWGGSAHGRAVVSGTSIREGDDTEEGAVGVGLGVEADGDGKAPRTRTAWVVHEDEDDTGDMDVDEEDGGGKEHESGDSRLNPRTVTLGKEIRGKGKGGRGAGRGRGQGRGRAPVFGDDFAESESPCAASTTPTVLTAYLREIKAAIVASAGAGVFVTCFWKEPLRMLSASLSDTHPDISQDLIDGDCTALHRGNVVLDVERGTTKVVFMTTACALSVTFTNLTTVLVVGACLNAAQQEQAVARVVGRIGQMSHTKVIYFNAVVRRDAGEGESRPDDDDEPDPDPESWHKTVQHAIQACHSGRRVVKQELLGDVIAGGSTPSVKECTSLLTRVLAVLREG